MKVLLRDEETGSYVGRETAWTVGVEGAAEYATVEEAVRKTLDYGHDAVVVVLRDEEPKKLLGGGLAG